MGHWMLWIGILMTWGSTALGAASVYLVSFSTLLNRQLHGLLGFAAGVMIAASVWSLIIPGMELAEEMGQSPIFMSSVGFLSGVAFLLLLDKVMPHLHWMTKVQEGARTSLKRSALMFLAVTLHNIPEGLAVGVAFGAAAQQGTQAAMLSAFALALGMALQNIPEGAAVSIALYNDGMKRGRAFNMGQLSGIVEPTSALLGLLLAAQRIAFMPFLLCFAAGAMMYVVVEELVPESQAEGHNHAGTIGAMIGFVIMMILDTALG